MADIMPPGGNSYRVFRVARKLDQKRDQGVKVIFGHIEYDPTVNNLGAIFIRVL